MKQPRSLTRWLGLIALLALPLQPAAVSAQGTTAFTYQGQLHDNGTNANGAYTLSFALYDAASGGNQIGGAVTTGATLVNGLFSVNLDFGAGAFNGGARWLDITVQCGKDCETLAPRVAMLPAPYAQYAATAATVANGAVGSAQLAPDLTVGGTLNAATGLQIGGTNLDIGLMNVPGPAGTGLAFTNALIFSANGLPYLGFLRVPGVGPVVYTPADLVSLGLECEGNLDVRDPNWNEVLGIDDYSLRMCDTNGNQVVQIDRGGNLTACGEIEARGTNGSFVVSDTNGNWSASIDSGGNVACSTLNSSGDIFASGDVNAFGDINGGTLTAGNQAAGITFTTYGGIHILDNCDITIRGNGQGGLDLGGSLNASGDISAASFQTTSDRNLKEHFAPVDDQEILVRVAALPISRWNFKADGQTPHIGPMAQDFYAAFNVGTDDRHIATVDEDGVALAAIQGLNEKLKEKDAQIEALAKRLADLEEVVKTAAQK